MLDPWVRKIPWRRERLPTPVFWPGEFHGPYSRKESDMIERLSLFLKEAFKVILPKLAPTFTLEPLSYYAVIFSVEFSSVLHYYVYLFLLGCLFCPFS